MLLAITAPLDNQRGPDNMQQALAALHQSLPRGVQVELLYGSYKRKVGHFCRVPDLAAPLVIEALRAKYRNCSIEPIDEQSLQPTEAMETTTWKDHLTLSPQLFPILRHAQFEDLLRREFNDPMETLLRSIQPHALLRPMIVIALRPASAIVSRRARRAVRVLDRPFFRRHELLAALYARLVMRTLARPLVSLLAIASRGTPDRQASSLDTMAGRQHQREDELQAAADKVGGHLFSVTISLSVTAPASERPLALQQLRAMRGAFGAFTLSRLAVFSSARPRPFLCSHEELSTLWHPPQASVESDALHRREFTELEAPVDLGDPEKERGVILGRVRHGDDRRLVPLLEDDRRRHLYVVGKTGMGKTTLLSSLISADIAAGRGTCVIDPHGDLAAETIRRIPPHRTSDVIVLDPSDESYAVPYNPLHCSDPQRRDLVADDVLSAFDRIYDFGGSHRMRDTLRNALYVLIEKDKTLLHLLRFFADPAFHATMLEGISDNLARSFWHTEFPSWNKQDRNLTVAAVQNKIRPFLMNRSIRAIVSQSGKSLHLRQVMDEGKVLIVNLSKGRIGEGNANMLGALLVAGIQQAAMSRADIPENRRRDFYLYVDEFQNFVSSSFGTILSEARKYRLLLTCAHQFLAQIEPRTLDAVFGNVGSMIAFQVGSDDARILVEQFSKSEGQLKPHDLTGIPKYHAFVRLLQDGAPSSPFTMETLPPEELAQDRTTPVLNASHRHSRQLKKIWQQIEGEFATL